MGFKEVHGCTGHGVVGEVEMGERRERNDFFHDLIGGCVTEFGVGEEESLCVYMYVCMCVMYVCSGWVVGVGGL